MPFVGSGSIHEAASEFGDWGSIASVKFLGADGTVIEEKHVGGCNEAKSDCTVYFSFV